MYTVINGINTHYEDRGSGDVIVILHGWGTNLSLYEGLISHLSKTHRVIVPELPGFGETPEPPAPWGVAEYSLFVTEFFRQLKIRRAILIGHSNGGRIIIKMTGGGAEIEIPKIVLIGSAGLTHEMTPEQIKRQKRYKLGKELLSSAPVKLLFPNALEDFKRKSGSEDYRNASPLMRDTLVKLVNEDLSGLLPLIKRPTLLIWGEKDDSTPLSDAKHMEELLPDAGLVVVKGAGHYCYLEQPLFVYRVLDSFLGVN